MSARDGARFWAKVDKSGDCWIWMSAKTRKGYGHFHVGGKAVRAHRFSLILAGVGIDGMLVDHTCRNRACVRPDHLRLVTNKQNCENLAGATRVSKSGIRGVSQRGNGWVAQVWHLGRNHRKRFDDIAEAEAWAIETRNRLYTHNDADRVAV